MLFLSQRSGLRQTMGEVMEGSLSFCSGQRQHSYSCGVTGLPSGETLLVISACCTGFRSGMPQIPQRLRGFKGLGVSFRLCPPWVVLPIHSEPLSFLLTAQRSPAYPRLGFSIHLLSQNLGPALM